MGSDACSMRETRPMLRSSDAAAPAFRLSNRPLNRSTAAISSVDRLSSSDFTISAEFTSRSTLSVPNPDWISRVASPDAIAPSTAARPPLPIPSLRITNSRPLPSSKLS